MADTTLSIGITAELADFRKALETLPGIGEKEARDMVTGIRRQLRAAESAAKSSANSVGTDFGSAFSGAEALVKRFGEKAGGSFATLSSLAIDGAKDFSKMLGPLGGIAPAVGAIGFAAAGSVASVAAAGVALVSLANSGREAQLRLEAMGIAVDQNTGAALEGWAAATKDVGIATDQLRATVGGAVAEEITPFAEAVSYAVKGLVGLASTVHDAWDALEGFRRVALAGVTLGLSELAGGYVASAAAANEHVVATERVTTTTLDAEAAIRAQLVALGMLMSVEEELATDRETRAAAEAAARAAETTAMADSAAARAAVLAQFSQADADFLAEIQFEQDLARAANDATAAFAEQRAEVARGAAEVQTLGAQVGADMDAGMAAWSKSTAVGVSTTIASMAGDAIGSISSITDSIVDSYSARVAAGEELTLAEAREANRALSATKTLSITQAGISSALLGISAMAQLSATGVPAPVAAALATSFAAAAFAAAVVGIQNGSPPRFHMGGGGQPAEQGAQRDALGLDDTPSQDEVTPSGGGKPGLDAGVTSRSRGGGGVVEVRVDPRLGRLEVRNVRRPGKK